MQNIDKAFPNFDNTELFNYYRDQLVDFGFTDQSWKNDVMPCLVFTTDENTYAEKVTVWFDYKDQSLSTYEGTDPAIGYITVAITSSKDDQTTEIVELNADMERAGVSTAARMAQKMDNRIEPRTVTLERLTVNAWSSYDEDGSTAAYVYIDTTELSENSAYNSMPEFIEEIPHIIFTDDTLELIIANQIYSRPKNEENLKILEAFLFDWLTSEHFEYAKIELIDNERSINPDLELVDRSSSHGTNQYLS